jgi:hypothetical protein
MCVIQLVQQPRSGFDHTAHSAVQFSRPTITTIFVLEQCIHYWGRPIASDTLHFGIIIYCGLKMARVLSAGICIWLKARPHCGNAERFSRQAAAGVVAARPERRGDGRGRRPQMSEEAL